MLKRVNLITGKNNTGKSSLLEAISIYAAKGNLSWIYQILESRGEIGDIESSKNKPQGLFDAFYSLFTGRPQSPVPEYIFVISPDVSSKHQTPLSDQAVSIGITHFVYDVQNDNKSILPKTKIPLRKPLKQPYSDGGALPTGIELQYGSNSTIFSIDELLEKIRFTDRESEANFQFIKSMDLDRELSNRLWSRITLTSKENDVIEAMKIIEPDIDKINFILSVEPAKKFVAVIKLRNKETVYPIKSMGDGINRLLQISLALVNSDNGFLLIDEFENGLHYSVQEQLWKIIFTMSKKLNVQVFATTHSHDCVKAFEKIINTGFKDDGALIKLKNINGDIKNVEFDSNELRIASEQDIDLR